MRKRIIHVINWDKYQARSDKELPWLKLWGRLFKAPWFLNMEDDEKFCTIAILDMARQFNNQLTEEMLFKEDLSGKKENLRVKNPYLKQIYGVFMSKERLFNLCNYLSDNGFLSDNVVGLEGDKIRVDKIRVEKDAENHKTKATHSDFKVSLSDIKIKGLEENEKHKLYNELINTFSARGWRIDQDFLKPIFKDIASKMESYNPREMFPYFRASLKNFINLNAEYLSKSCNKETVNPKLASLIGGIGNEK